MNPKDLKRKNNITSTPIPKELKGEERLEFILFKLLKQEGIKKLMKSLADK